MSDLNPRGYQQPIPFKEYFEGVEEIKPFGKTHIYSGYNISGRPGGIFEHDHGHDAYNPGARPGVDKPYYSRGLNGERNM